MSPLPAICRIFIAFCLALLLSVPAAGAHYENGIPVLLYHHVGPPLDMPELTLPPAEFDRQMAALAAGGFRTISPDELMAYMRGESVALPDRPVLITFDDGYEDNCLNAWPILRKYGFQAAVFMVGINFDRRDRLSGDEVRAMAADGFTVGSHSATHPDLTALDAAALATEVTGSKLTAERVIRRRVDYFAYPGGFYGPAAVEAVRNAGYAGAFTVLTGLNRPGYDDAYLLRRIPVFSFTDFDRLLALLAANAPKTSLLQYDLVKPGYEKY